MSGIRQLGADMRRIVGGISAFWQYLRAQNDVEVAFGLLSAASKVARRGESSRYVVRIANASRDPVDLTLTMDIHASKNPIPSDGHYAAFTKRLPMPPCSAMTITIEYDWMAHAAFYTDGRALPPDDFGRGTAQTSQIYTVTALLGDRAGRWMDELSVYQELIG
jgi:hypothetical protein